MMQARRYGASIAKMILQTSTLQVWHWFNDWNRGGANSFFSIAQGGGVSWGNDILLKLEGDEYMQLKQWMLPTKAELLAFRKFKANPARSESRGYGDNAGRLYGAEYWLCREGLVILDYNNRLESSGEGYVFAYHTLAQSDPLGFWRIMREQKVQLAHFPSNTLLPIPDLDIQPNTCLLYTSPSPRDRTRSRMPSSA